MSWATSTNGFAKSSFRFAAWTRSFGGPRDLLANQKLICKNDRTRADPRMHRPSGDSISQRGDSDQLGFDKDLPQIRASHYNCNKFYQFNFQRPLNLFRNTSSERNTIRASQPSADSWSSRLWTTVPGISPELLLEFREPFFSTKSRGMGLGLPITKSIINSHGGELTIGPRSPGEPFLRFYYPSRQGGGLCNRLMIMQISIIFRRAADCVRRR